MFFKTHKSWAVNGVLALIIFLAFLPSLSNGFILTWDDTTYLLKNPLVCSLDFQNLLNIFTTPLNKLYTPLTTLSFALEYHFFGFNPWIYHFDNLLLHLGVVGLILVLAGNIGISPRAAYLTALLFAVHPVHVESVAWVSERKDCLYAFFYMLALVQYVQYVNLEKKSHFYLSLGWGLLSMLSKPMAVSLPIVLLILDWFLKRRLNWRERIEEKIFYLIYMLPLLGITCSYWPLYGVNFKITEGVLIWIWSFVSCVVAFICPLHLTVHYVLPQPVIWYHPLYIGALLLFILFICSIYRFQENRYYVFAWMFYIFSIFFILKINNAINLGNSSYMGDRFMYLPSLGFCLWIGVLFDGLLQTSKSTLRKFIYSFLVVLFCFLSVKTYLQTMIWKNDITLWSYAIQRTPDDPLAYIDRALAYEKIKKYDLAIADDSKAIGIDPDYYVSALEIRRPMNNDQQREIDRTNALLRNNPYYVLALRNRGKVYQLINKNDLALKDFNEVFRIDPKDPEIYSLIISSERR